MIEVSSSSNGSSSDGTSRSTVMRKTTKKNPAKSTLTLQMFLERYPEVKDRSSKEQKHLYMVYKLYLNGATSEDLEKYTTNAFNFWNCCKDGETSTGCKIHVVNYYSGNTYCGASPNAKPYGINTECMLLGVLFFSRKTCCQHWPLITVWVTRLGLGINVSNTLIGDTR